MSKQIYTFPRFLAVLAIFLHFLNNVQGQSFEATIKIEPGSSKARVEGRFLGGERPKRLSFLLARGGIAGLGSRISEVTLSNAGQTIGSRRFSDGEYVSDADFDNWNFSVDLSPKRPADSAHLSWLSIDRGVLMTDDFLPQLAGESKAGRVRFDLPEGWQVVSGGMAGSSDWFPVGDVEDSVFVVGNGWRSRDAAEGKLTFVTHGQWLFTDEDAAAMTAEVYSEYRKRFGGQPEGVSQIVVSHFPSNVTPGNWEAETRGNTVLIMSSDMPFATQSKQRLHEQLRHELFHLWLPNGVNLKGNYDWFYEGFALYESLKMAVSLNRIRFEDYLDTLSRARFIAEASPKRRSLVDASNNRFAGSETELYARGMATAFLCDLSMIEASSGKRSVEDLLRTVFQKYRNIQIKPDGSEAVTGVMNEFAELRPIVERHVKGTDKIDWPSYLGKAGIELRQDGTAIFVTAKPNKRQKALLDELGYNNWRKSASPTR